ncbi:PQQ-like beta-propeller repeat protein [Yinghuangia soli]|uniref:PQQ-like beta-propeller repeat protein n=1 Tax=Yinghuangia soli TaxID=2908204 RepID=A0AA41Q619_9ACTN|nr:PQQ-like beta-propeller repeat protein [Yinghuangia soli]MCF2531009.1 PQQ-like beta-propeller repeat protein [Yinghuangia soli]
MTNGHVPRRALASGLAGVVMAVAVGATGCGDDGSGGGKITPWSAVIDGSRPSDPVLGDGAVYVAYELPNHQGRVVAMEAGSGKVRWSVPLAGLGSGTRPVVAGRTLLVNNTGGVYALNTATGETRWKYEDGIYGNIGHPGVIGETVVFGREPDGLKAVDLATGKDKGEFGEGDSYDFAPTGQGDLIIAVGSESTGVVAFDAKTFEERWRHKVASEPQQAPSVDGNVLYVNANSEGVYALDAATGDEKWHTDVSVESEAQPIVGNGTVYIGGGSTSSTELYALDAATGKVRWKSEVSGDPSKSPEVIAAGSGDTVYAGNRSRALFAFDPAKGTSKGTITLAGEPISALAASRAGVYVILRDPTGEFVLVALDGRTSAAPTGRKT